MSYRFKELYSGGGIIEVDALPNRDIDENAFYFVDGKYYRWGKNGNCVFHNVLSIPEEMYVKSYYFTYSVIAPNDEVWTFNEICFDSSGEISFYDVNGYGIETVYYPSSGWSNKNYKNIKIIEPPTDETFIAWLNENTTKESGWQEYVVASSDVELPIYNGEAIYAEEIDCGNNHIYFSTPLENTIVKNSVVTKVTLEEFGDAEKRYVVKGKSFTSKDGYRSEGEMPIYDGTILTAERNEKHDTDDGLGFEAFVGVDVCVQDYVYFNLPQSELSSGDIIDSDEDPTKKSPTDRPPRGSVVRYNSKYYKYNETNVFVFKDELSIPEEMRGNSYSIGYSVNTPNDGVQTFDSMDFSSDGIEIAFYRNSDGYFIDCVYGDGWTKETFKTITITEMPTDEVFLEWLRDNATAEGSWEEYAETTSITPTASETWVFNEELTSLDKQFANGYEDVACSGYMLYDKIDEPFNFHFTAIRFYPDSVYLRNSDTNGICIYYIDNFTYNFRHATITFTELPDDEAFLAWLKENATKMSGGDSDADDSIVGTWVFNDELTMPDEFGSFYFDYSVDTQMDGTQRLAEVCIFTIDEQMGYWGISYYGSDYNIEDVYESNYGWATERYKTIKITKEPTDQAFISWLKENATKISGGSSGTGATAYTAKSVDELPNDAHEGSTAIVDSDSVQGEWQFNCEEPLNFDDLKFDLTKNMKTYVFLEGYSDMTNFFSSIQFDIRDGEITVRSGFIIYADGEWDDMFNPFKFYGDVIGIQSNLYSSSGLGDKIDAFTKEQFLSWLKTNAERLSGGHSLYIRQNGEWVYNSEVS